MFCWADVYFVNIAIIPAHNKFIYGLCTRPAALKFCLLNDICIHFNIAEWFFYKEGQNDFGTISRTHKTFSPWSIYFLLYEQQTNQITRWGDGEKLFCSHIVCESHKVICVYTRHQCDEDRHHRAMISVPLRCASLLENAILQMLLTSECASSRLSAYLRVIPIPHFLLWLLWTLYAAQ